MAFTNSTEPISQTLLNNSSIDSPFNLNTLLSVIALIILYLLWRYIEALPKRIHEEAIKELEHKLAIALTEIKGRLDRDTELLKILRSQVEPQKIDAYLAIAETCGELFAVHLANQQKLPPAERERQIESNKAIFLLDSRLFLFASDETINKYISIEDDALVKVTLSPSFNQYAAFMVSMRQDLHSNTQIDATHFHAIFGKIKHS